MIENVDSINNIRLTDGQINESTNHMTINTMIIEKVAILIVEFQVLFHGKGGRLSTKVVTIKKNVEGIFVLIEENAFVRVDSFETKEIFQNTEMIIACN